MVNKQNSGIKATQSTEHMQLAGCSQELAFIQDSPRQLTSKLSPLRDMKTPQDVHFPREIVHAL